MPDTLSSLLSLALRAQATAVATSSLADLAAYNAKEAGVAAAEARAAAAALTEAVIEAGRAAEERAGKKRDTAP